MRILAVYFLLAFNNVLIADDASPFREWKMVDLSHSLEASAPVYPGSTAFKLERRMSLDAGFYLNDFTMSEHCGTHVDAPSHKAKGGKNLEEISLPQLHGPLVVINVRSKCTDNPDYAITIKDIRDFEREHGIIPEGAFVFADTGWCDKWGSAEEYLNIGDDNCPHFPGYSAEVTQFLLLSRKTKGMGIDTLSTDPGNSKDYLQHKIFLGGGGVNIENVTNLKEIPAAGAFVLVTPLKIKGGSGGPARVIAFVKEARR